ncbi:hypothetical protein P153DRAFT_370559 [Dothidotthia symphoricarpi CBS 119687]|uniref:Uncharacterized protein n=1 Tax=Dothidotthia symphoricarpi CBS 119687 TaxID=1392245 RepID=A0A6A5ZYF9_9PLEO|nr:uncharacterized protein P153DRAFT_370559 [Dothidotthia symphoricarpi CBS 119687]KAF2124630.1 hypothetical protein P153DRAFT_370559 [Dothidotthia symphoricarpi CBS 119687]
MNVFGERRLKYEISLRPSAQYHHTSHPTTLHKRKTLQNRLVGGSAILISSFSFLTTPHSPLPSLPSPLLTNPPFTLLAASPRSDT